MIQSLHEAVFDLLWIWPGTLFACVLPISENTCHWTDPIPKLVLRRLFATTLRSQRPRNLKKPLATVEALSPHPEPLPKATRVRQVSAIISLKHQKASVSASVSTDITYSRTAAISFMPGFRSFRSWFPCGSAGLNVTRALGQKGPKALGVSDLGSP